MEKISVIVPIYNTYSYLEKCLMSVVSQTYPNLEIILVNDCSSDKSYQICKKFLETHKNIRYYEFKENKPANKSQALKQRKSGKIMEGS